MRWGVFASKQANTYTQSLTGPVGHCHNSETLEDDGNVIWGSFDIL